ncbi:PglZ domain-containing protein [Neiella marina]|uniref:PglZ domain-containing protein n=1 Tax=Neiella holothuriorum TaxID=2870530 RepID=A0ABS7EGH6_9GAMM|nr:PglZ domain-containing protein [Neiella holothuriorum]MBW8191425.1 PglZ domain-containing protein [Neiella holothuriorum]
MSIEQYIKSDILEKRLADTSVLVIYDGEQRYHQLAQELATDQCTVIDVGEGSLATRQQAISTLSQLKSGKQLLIYVPKAAPMEEEEKQKDPFALYAVAGSVFPDPERSGDNYLDICLKAKPDQATEIRELFAQNEKPSFDVINAIGGGVNWPTLQAALGAEGASNLLFKLMVASKEVQAKLAAESSWYTEAQSLLSSSLGLALRTKQRSWSAIADELWRFVLFSEFVFELNEAVPTSLADVPVAKLSAKPIIEELGDNLRKHTDYQNLYIERASSIETELKLDSLCANITKLGHRDTFPFEEKCYLRQAIDALLADNGDLTRKIVSEHANSVWSSNSESLVNWELVKSSQRLLETCEDLERELPNFIKKQNDLIEFYQSSLRRADQLHREFEQAVNDCPNADELMPGVVGLVRKHYRKLVEPVQQGFTHFTHDSGWPPAEIVSNTQLFDSKVSPLLKSRGNRVAYLMVDALRYELGYELNKQLAEDADTQLSVSFATLPSITSLGMASLLPGAYDKLSLALEDGKTKALYDGKPVGEAEERMGVFKSNYGDRFAEMPLKDFVKMPKKKSVESSVDLLVLRTTEIDSFFESHPEDAPAMMQRELKQIRQAVNKLQDQGFQKVFIVTDHGFYMNNAQEAGDTVTKPDNCWKVEHQRMLLGTGNLDEYHYSLSSNNVGIKSNIQTFAGPRSLSPYRRGKLYYHGGLSLQECLLPVIEITLKPNVIKGGQTANVKLDYKKGAKRITTRFAVIELTLESLSADLFGGADDLEATEVLLEAHSGTGKNLQVVGEARPGEYVNAATGTVTLEPGETIKVTLKMDPEFEGSFKVKAIDPVTNTMLGSALELQTDYAV